MPGDGEEQALRQLVSRLLDQDPVDVVRLREVAATHGLVDAKTRSRAWPKLLGVNPYDPQLSITALATAAQTGHPDAATVTVDVQRCAWLPRHGLAGAELAVARATLEQLINGAVCVARAMRSGDGASGSQQQQTHYFQGLHDVAAVLWLTCGTQRAGACLVGLLNGHLRDCAGSDLTPVIAQLALLRPLLHRADPEQAAFLGKAARKSGMTGAPADGQDPGAPSSSSDVPYFNTDFALSWCLTWFAHSAPDMETVCRLFDLCVASSPLMPLYIGAAACVAGREQLLRGPCDAAEAHRLLSALPAVSRTKVEGGAGAGALVRAARTLALKLPPKALGAGLQPTSAGHGDASWPYHDTSSRGQQQAASTVIRPDRVLKYLARAGVHADNAQPADPFATDAAFDNSATSSVAAREDGSSGRGDSTSAWGERTMPHGATYSGESRTSKCSCSERHGLGLLVQPGQKEAYSGLWHSDVRHGVGVNVWSDGASYAGDWAGDHLHGYGVFTWPSGKCFAGEWRNDKRHGWGVSYASATDAARCRGTGARYIHGVEAEREGTVGVEGDGADSARKARQAATEALAAADRLQQELAQRGMALPPLPAPRVFHAVDDESESLPPDAARQGAGLKQRRTTTGLVAF